MYKLYETSISPVQKAIKAKTKYRTAHHVENRSIRAKSLLSMNKQKTVYKQCQNKLSCSALNDDSNDSNGPPIYLRTVEKSGEKTKIWIIKEPSWKQTKRY